MFYGARSYDWVFSNRKGGGYLCIYMKKSLFFTLVLTCVCVICSGQEILSNEAAFRAEYRFLYKMDSLKQGYFSDVFHLDICRSGHSYFYSRATQYRDSVKYASLSQGLDAYQASNAIRGLPKGLPWYVDKRFVEGKYLYFTHILYDVFKGTENLILPEWKHSEDTLSINGILCKYAQAKIAGRIWKVWYAPEIPLNDGPWLLWGLPGLIMKAEDSNGYFKFICDNVGELKEPYFVLLQGDYNNTREMKMEDVVKAETMYGLEPQKFISAYGYGTVIGPPVPKRYYIPLFRIEK